MSSPTTRRPLVLAAVMASSFMIAMEDLSGRLGFVRLRLVDARSRRNHAKAPHARKRTPA
jgi:hypothetical protein